jgi:hypothetical protein
MDQKRSHRNGTVFSSFLINDKEAIKVSALLKNKEFKIKRLLQLPRTQGKIQFHLFSI